MEIKDFNKSLIFIDESTLSHPQFFDLMISLSETDYEYKVFTDVSINHYTEKLKSIWKNEIICSI